MLEGRGPAKSLESEGLVSDAAAQKPKKSSSSWKLSHCYSYFKELMLLTITTAGGLQVKQIWVVDQFGNDVIPARDYCVTRNVTLRADRPDPSLRIKRLRCLFPGGRTGGLLSVVVRDPLIWAALVRDDSRDPLAVCSDVENAVCLGLLYGEPRGIWANSVFSDDLHGGFSGVLPVGCQVCTAIQPVERNLDQRGWSRIKSKDLLTIPRILHGVCMRPFRALVLLFAFLSLLSNLTFAVQPDRITGAIDSGTVIRLKGNVHGLARRDFDLGRVNGGEPMSGVSLVFKPSATQQAALDKLLKEQQERSSPNYHKWLTPAQFADRFGMSKNDVNKVTGWLQSQGFTVTRVANSRNQVFFEGTVAQVEAVFHTEIHNYVHGGQVHFANATEPSVPMALSGLTIGLQHLHNFQPKPRARVRAVPHLTSYITGNHFLTPADVATIYDVQAFGSVDGTGQKIAIIGQSAVNLTDLHNFRTAAGLPAKDPAMVFVPGTGSSTTICPGDEGESDLDLEWSGAIAKNADIIFVHAGLGSGADCNHRTAGAFDALFYAIDNNLASIISNSYGNCEANIGQSGALTMQGWAQEANSFGQTIFSASGDSGAADCDFQVTTAIQGLAVDLPAALPEVTAVGGTEFDGDVAGVVSGTPPNTDAAATAFWGGTTNSTDNLASALSYIPETSWNDTAFDIANGGNISASGGGASIFFEKPYWQAAGGMPLDNARDVPDIALNGSADHDGYLICSEDSPNVQSCANGFRDASANQRFTVVGGTSAGVPAMAGIWALFNEFNGFAGSGNVNSFIFYELASSYPDSFNDIVSGDNIVPCTSGTPDCKGGLLGFNASSGFDLVTGLGSINAFQLALNSQAPTFDFFPDLSSVSIVRGGTATINFTINPANGFTGTLNFSGSSCQGLPSEATCSFSPASVIISSATQSTVTLTITTTAPKAKLTGPMDRGHGIFFAALLPGLLGMFGVSFPGKVRARGGRMLILLAVLASSTVWMGACGGSSHKDPGTPVGTYTVVVTATTGGSTAITTNASIIFNVN